MSTANNLLFDSRQASNGTVRIKIRIKQNTHTHELRATTLRMDIDNCNRNYKMLNVQAHSQHNMELPPMASTHDTTVGRCSPLLSSGIDSKVNFIFTQEQVECVCEVSVKLNAPSRWVFMWFWILTILSTLSISFALSHSHSRIINIFHIPRYNNNNCGGLSLIPLNQ